MLEESYNWQGINLSRQNMCNWQQKVYKALLPLENQFKNELKKGKFLQMDETPLEVLKVNEDEVRSEYWDEDKHRKKDSENDFGKQNLFLNAASAGPRTGVIISGLNENYWKKTYYSCGRLLPAV